MTRVELENRLIKFSVSVIELIEILPDSKVNNHLGSQLMRSATSAALNYGEAQSGESKKDFIHKMKIILKELRESFVNLSILNDSNLSGDIQKLEELMNEANELISIFVVSVRTAEKNK